MLHMLFRLSLWLLYRACQELSLHASFVLANTFLSFFSQLEKAPEVLEYEKWLTQLDQELENEGISLPERYW